MKPPSAQVPGIKRHGEKSMKLKLAQDTCVWSSLRTEARNKDLSSIKAWIVCSKHPGFTTKKNHRKRIIHEEDIDDSFRHFTEGPEKDMRVLNGVYHPDHKEPSFKLSCFGLLTHHKHAANWIHTKIHFGLRVIQFLNQVIVDLPYLTPSGFGILKSYVWRPGELPLQLEYSKDVSSFISRQWIRWIQAYLFNLQEFPYLDPNAFTLGAITLQRNFPFLQLPKHDFESIYMNQRLLSHGYMKKISRYKEEPSIFSYLAMHLSLQRLVSFKTNLLIFLF